MKNVNIQWVTQDPSLFELDWLCEMLGVDWEEINIVRNDEQFKSDKNSVVICNHAINYRYFLDKLKSNAKLYGIILLSDENLREPCEWLHDPHCKFNLRNYIHFMHYQNPKVTTFGLGYKCDLTTYLTHKNSSERKYNWVFAGTPHGNRKEMIELFTDISGSKTHYCSGFGARDGLTTQAYAELLNDAKFALCPPGQDSMDSFRIYEALEAGCIPITLSNSGQLQVRPSYWHAIFSGVAGNELPFIVGDSWGQCLAKTKIAIEKNQLDDLQAQCKKLWEQAKDMWKNKLQEKIELLA